MVYTRLDYSRVKYCMVRYGTVQYGTIRHHTVPYGAIRYRTVLYNTVQYGTVLHRTYTYVQYGTVRYGTVLYTTVQYKGMRRSRHFLFPPIYSPRGKRSSYVPELLYPLSRRHPQKFSVMVINYVAPTGIIAIQKIQNRKVFLLWVF